MPRHDPIIVTDAKGRRREHDRRLVEQVFRELDAGKTRSQVQAELKRARGQGVGNDAFAALRQVHRDVRRSQGFDVRTRGKKVNIRQDVNAPIRTRDQIAADARLAAQQRPLPPENVEGLPTRVTVAYDSPDGPRIGSFRTGEDAASLEDQVRIAMQAAADDSEAPAHIVIEPGGFTVVNSVVDL